MDAKDETVHQLTSNEMYVLSRRVMHKQAVLSLRVAVIFIILILGIPLVNFYRPDLAGIPILGFTASWLFLAVLFYPITWALSFYFVTQSDRLEAQSVHWQEEIGSIPTDTHNDVSSSELPEDPTL